VVVVLRSQSAAAAPTEVIGAATEVEVEATLGQRFHIPQRTKV
jgi:hypothetical protein